MKQAWTITPLLSCLVLVTTPLHAAPPPETLLREAQTLLDNGDSAGAITKYDEARSIDPASPELAYNLGIAKYRAGEFLDAARLFRESAASATAGLAAKAMFNQGTAVYADALNRLPKPGSPPSDESSKVLQEAIEAVGKSLTHFRDAANADPTDADSRANAERAWRLLKKLKEEQEKQEQQQKKDDQKKPDQKPDQKPDEKQDQKQDQKKNDKSEDQKDQQKEDQKGQDQQKQDQKKQEQGDQGQQSDQQEKQDPKEQSNSKPDGKPDQPKDPKEKEDQQGQPKEAPQKPSEAKDPQQADGKAQQKAAISPADAERLLQMVRDKEKARRAQLLRQQRAKQQPVPKDW